MEVKERLGSVGVGQEGKVELNPEVWGGISGKKSGVDVVQP